MSAAALTRDGVLVAVALTDANQEGAIFVLGGQQQLLSFQAVNVPIIPPAHKHNTDQRRKRRHGCTETQEKQQIVTFKELKPSNSSFHDVKDKQF